MISPDLGRQSQSDPPAASSSRLRLPPSNAKDHRVSLPVTTFEQLARSRSHLPEPRSPLDDTSSLEQAEIDAIPYLTKWRYYEILSRLRKQLRLSKRKIKTFIDWEDTQTAYEQDKRDRSFREFSKNEVERMRAGLNLPEWAKDTNVFGAPLKNVVLIASTSAIMQGFRHDLPIVLVACIEELYRHGIDQPGLFRNKPHRERQVELAEIFNVAPLFGYGTKLTSESRADVAALLCSYLKNLPIPVLGEPLFEPLWHWCILPTVKCEDQRRREEDEEFERQREAHTGPGIFSLKKLSAKKLAARQRAIEEEEWELAQPEIPNVQLLLRLLPTHQLSVLYYLCEFFSQVTQFPENGLTLDNVAFMFGEKIFGGSPLAARQTMAWFLKRWTLIREGLLVKDLGPEIPEPPPSDDEEESPEDEDSDEDIDYNYGYGTLRPAKAKKSGSSSSLVPEAVSRSSSNSSSPSSSPSLETPNTSDISGDAASYKGKGKARADALTIEDDAPTLPPLPFVPNEAVSVRALQEQLALIQAQLEASNAERDNALLVMKGMAAMLGK